VIPLLAIALAAVLVLPAAVAQAKITCEEPHLRDRGAPVEGLPEAPVAGRTYTVTATLAPDEGVNPTPHLGAEYCGDAVPHEATAGAGGWFRRRGGGEYVLELRFRHHGPWMVSFMDRHGGFHELGMRTVLPANGFWPAPDPEPLPRAALRAFGPVVWMFEPGALL
jgi:hypothetical protein